MKTAFNCRHTGFSRTNKRPAARGPHPCGFTLIEILVAISILGIVISLVMGSFGGLFADADHINIGTDIHEMGNACLNRMAADLKAVHVATYPRYKPPDIDDTPEIYHVKGETRSTGGKSFGWLRFASTAHLPFSRDVREGIAQIVYYVRQTENGDYVLHRADTLYPYPETFEANEKDPILCEQLQRFNLVYYDANGREFDEWDSESDDHEYGTPRAVGIELTIGTEENSYAFSSQVPIPVFRHRQVKR